MKGYIIDNSGAATELPEFLSWDVCHGVGEPCDWFEVSFIYYASQLPVLRSGCRFRAKNRNFTVFTGVIDEYSVSIDKNGCVVTLSGRGLAALLLDNELPAQDCGALSSPMMVSKFITPYGISGVKTGPVTSVDGFSVRTGESAWSAVRRYCRYAWNTVPYFTTDGKLILSGADGLEISVDASKDAASIALTDERYGIISDITVRNRVTGTSYTKKNEPFIARGGKSHREMTVPKNAGADAARYNADYQIAESQRGKKYIKMTLTQQFACFPADIIKLTAEKLGVSGSFSVISSHCWADSMSAGTIVTLEV